MEEPQMQGLETLIESEGVERIVFALWIICLRKTMRSDSQSWQKCVDILRSAMNSLNEVEGGSERFYKIKHS